MSNLRNSIFLFFAYVIIVLGLAQVTYIEENVLNFTPTFFVLFALAALFGLFVPLVTNFSIYAYLLFWSAIYVLTWFFYWRIYHPSLDIQILGIQFILVAISAGLAFDLGRHLRMMGELFEELAATTYPNRTLEFSQAQDRVSAELTRSRRYHHSLSVLIVELVKGRSDLVTKQLDGLQRDLLRRFAIARIGQIVSERARETDLILRDRNGRFVLLCPETTVENSAIFGERIRRAVLEHTGADVIWGSASFPDEALTFDELIERAEQRLSQPAPALESREALPADVEDRTAASPLTDSQ